MISGGTRNPGCRTPCSSLPQIPADRTCTRVSPRATSGSGSSRSSTVAGAVNTSAFTPTALCAPLLPPHDLVRSAPVRIGWHAGMAGPARKQAAPAGGSARPGSRRDVQHVQARAAERTARRTKNRHSYHGADLTPRSYRSTVPPSHRATQTPPSASTARPSGTAFPLGSSAKGRRFPPAPVAGS